MVNKPSPYRLTPRAETDLEEIWVYTFKTWSMAQADRYHNDIVEVFEGLSAGRLNGRPVDVRDGYLKYPAGAHMVFYRLTDDALVIVRVLHKRMDVERHL